MRSALEVACLAERASDLHELPDRLPDVEVGARSVMGIGFGRRGSARSLHGVRHTLSLSGDRLTVEWLEPEHISVRYDLGEAGRPHVLAVVDFGCRLEAARLLRYDEDGRPAWLVHLDADLEPTAVQEPLNPEVPSREDPGGVPVALVDTGVNYLLPEIGTALARDPDGRLLGYDYWDMDDRPFDVHPAASAFFPDRHGTGVASVVLAEAPVARLLPYRYPRPDMRRMPALIEHAAGFGARIVNLSLFGLERRRWVPFLAAALRHPEMLFVVAAGNGGIDLDRRPGYPAALPLDNLITVTAATADGRLASGVNWGARTVDLMVPADDLRVLDHNGRAQRVGGSSYAAARVTALAACLLATHPEWSVEALKAAVFDFALPLADGSDVVAVGFLPDPSLGERGACAALGPSSGL